MDAEIDERARVLLEGVARCAWPVRRGRLSAVGEQVLEAEIPGARVGEQVLVERPGGRAVEAEVAVCRGSSASLLPFSESSGVGPGDEVRAVAVEPRLPCGAGLLGRAIDPFGRPRDGGPSLRDVSAWPLRRPAPDPLSRPPIDTQLVSGLRALDGCLPIGIGQRVGLFAGPGLGKSTLLGTLARRAHCDVAVVCLVGERGREVREFIDGSLGARGLARSAVVVAPADAPPLVRFRALESATAIAEWFRERGDDVLLVVDSLTRVVRARRDAALALGEPPARGGYPASAFAALPGLLERAGRDERGSITAVYAVLTEGGGEGADDPVAEEARSLLDGHVVLSRKLAEAGRWPAIDLLRSVSRVAPAVAPAVQLAHAAALRRMLAALSRNEDLILMGAYRRGSSPETDAALEKREAIERFLAQGSESCTVEETRNALAALAG
ncbi:MAG: FliI/YscN family ATPase [Polyangia bacterium]